MRSTLEPSPMGFSLSTFFCTELNLPRDPKSQSLFPLQNLWWRVDRLLDLMAEIHSWLTLSLKLTGESVPDLIHVQSHDATWSYPYMTHHHDACGPILSELDTTPGETSVLQHFGVFNHLSLLTNPLESWSLEVLPCGSSLWPFWSLCLNTPNHLEFQIPRLP
jgi:hypothetical protein